jgi:hypothetical protein
MVYDSLLFLVSFIRRFVSRGGAKERYVAEKFLKLNIVASSHRRIRPFASCATAKALAHAVRASIRTFAHPHIRTSAHRHILKNAIPLSLSMSPAIN